MTAPAQASFPTLPAKRPVVALVLEPYQREIHMGIIRAARELDWDLDDSRCFCGGTGFRYGEKIPDAILTTSCTPAVLSWISEAGCPAVALASGSGVRAPAAVSLVELDFARAGALAARHLSSLGYPNLAYVQCSQDSDAMAQLAGFQDACRQHGRTFQLMEYPAADTTGPGLAPGRGIPRRDWLAWLGNRIAALPLPCAIMAQDDRDALEIIRAAADCGLRVPEDLAVMGCMNLEMLHSKSQVPLTSIDMNLELAGYTAARLLAQVTHQGDGTPARVMVPPLRLIERRSTFSFACEIPAVARTLMRIRRDYAEKLTVPALAKEAGMSVRTLQRMYGSITGSSISDDLLKRRLEVASSLLRETSLKLESIARAVGLGSANHLCHLFRERHGKTPRQWRDSQEDGEAAQNEPLPLKSRERRSGTAA